jgi:hypothetical protein
VLQSPATNLFNNLREFPGLPQTAMLLTPNSRNRLLVVGSLVGFTAVQCHLNDFAMGLTLTVRYGIPVNIA